MREFEEALRQAHAEGFAEGYAAYEKTVAELEKAVKEMKKKLHDHFVKAAERMLDCGYHRVSTLTDITELSELEVREIARRKGVELIG